MELPLLQEILILFSASIVVGYLASLLKIPLMVALLFTGMLAGPYGLALVAQPEVVKVLAEIGVILLLFSIGLEFSFEKLLEMKTLALVGGVIQLLLAVGLTVWFLVSFDIPLAQAVFIGSLVAMSSTAIVIKILQQQMQLNAPHGRVALGILIFQDLAVVFLMMLVPVLAGIHQSETTFSSAYLIKLCLFAAFLFAAAKWLVPHLLYHVLSTRNRELFMMAIAFLAFFIAWLANQLGLSLAFGAFIAGLIVAESEYNQGAVANIQPLRDLFMGFFFVSIGMLFDYRLVAQEPLLLLGLLVILIIIKVTANALAVLALGYPLRTVLISSMALAQIGEFSFVLATLGVSYRLFTLEQYQLFLALTISSMMLTPVLITWSKWLSLRVRDRRLFSLEAWDDEREEEVLTGHIIIVGYGVNGRNLARVARASNISYIVIDTNPKTIKEELAKGESIFFGDAVRKEVLMHAGIKQARVLALAVSDPAAEQAIISEARHLNPEIYIIARTRYVSETLNLQRLGANEVIPEEFETSIEMFARVLNRYHVAKDRIEELIAEIRSDNYGILRDARRGLILNSGLPGMETATLTLTEQSSLCQQTLAQANFRQNYQVNVIGLIRAETVLANPGATFQLQAGDKIIVIGKPESVGHLRTIMARTG